MNYYGSVPSKEDVPMALDMGSKKPRVNRTAFLWSLAAFALVVLGLSTQYVPAVPMEANGVQPAASQKQTTAAQTEDTKTSPWCFDCQERCANVRQALKENNAEISAEARQAKFGTLASDIGKFYRGTDHLYLQDMFQAPDQNTYHYTSDRTKCFNDADQHINNFGSFQDSKGQVVYDLNDFDQSMIAQYVIDLNRLGASIIMQMTENGMSSELQQQAIAALGFSYSSVLHKLQGNEEANFQLTKENSFGKLHDFLVHVETNTQKYGRVAMLNKYTTLVSKGPAQTRMFNTSRQDLSAISPREAHAIASKWQRYVDTLEDSKKYSADFYNIKHSVVNRLGAGVGSSGNTRWYVLVEGPTLSNDDDYILDVKHEPEPEWGPYVDDVDRALNKAAFQSEGQRAALGYRFMSGKYSDALLGWFDMGDPYGSFLVKQRPPCKGSLSYEGLTDIQDWLDLSAQWGMVLATNHARGDNDAESVIKYSFEEEFVNMLHGDEKGFAKNLWDQSDRYYKRVVGDFECFKDWSEVSVQP